NRFHRQPRPTSQRSRHCSVTSRLHTRHFASYVRFLGGKRRCLSSARTRGNRRLVCIRHAAISQLISQLTAAFFQRHVSWLTRLCVNFVRTYRNDWKCILSQAAARSWKPAARELGAGEERPRRAG